jgi:hypothetical protein
MATPTPKTLEISEWSPAEQRLVAGIVSDYRRLCEPHDFQHWIDSCAQEEARRIQRRVEDLIEAELARHGASRDSYWSARADVMFRIGWALGAAAARGVAGRQS